MVVNFALYLKALGWDAAAIGILLTASGIVGAVLSLGIGYYSDRYGRRRFILTYEALTVAAAAMATIAAAEMLHSRRRRVGGVLARTGPPFPRRDDRLQNG